MAQEFTNDRPFHGFGVFGMITAPDHEKDDEKSKAPYAEIESGRSVGLGGDTYYGYRRNLYDEVRANFARSELPVNKRRVHLHMGRFSETRPNVASRIAHVSLAHIDFDWYEPVNFCLDAIAPLMSSHGAIIIDDYK